MHLACGAGERGNDDFLLHYGFVPPRNPHDDVTLFTGVRRLQLVTQAGFVSWLACCSLGWLHGLAYMLASSTATAGNQLAPSTAPRPSADIEAAIDWWMDTFLPLGALPPERLQAAINSAYTSAQEQDGTALAAERVLAAVPEAEAEVMRAELARIKLSGEAGRFHFWGLE